MKYLFEQSATLAAIVLAGAAFAVIGWIVDIAGVDEVQS